MDAYHTVRACLGFISLVLALMIWKKKIGYLLIFSFLMAIQGAFLVSPAFVDDPLWLRAIQTPFAFFRLVLAAVATIEVFWFMAADTFPQERYRLAAASSAIGAIPVWAAWRFRPENWYQSAMILREYALMWLTVSFLVAWLWVKWLRPIRVSARISEHGTLWGMFLMVSATVATMTKGGLFWLGLGWKGAAEDWQFYGTVALLVQFWICALFFLNLLNWPKAEDVPGGRPFSLSPRNLLPYAPLSTAIAQAVPRRSRPFASS